MAMRNQYKLAHQQYIYTAKHGVEKVNIYNAVWYVAYCHCLCYYAKKWGLNRVPK